MSHSLVLGAGMSGLSAVRELFARGETAEIFDKGRGIGGRLATRRVANARLDHGAQFFTTRSQLFADTVAEAVAAGAVAEWCRGFEAHDGYPRYRGTTGMTDFAKWLGDGLTITLGSVVARIVTEAGQVSFLDADGGVLAVGDNAVITAPIPQMLALFDRSGITPPPPLDEQLRAMSYFATLALLVVVDGTPNVAEPGGMQFTDGPFTFVAENHRKGISAARALTFHAEHDYSLRRFDEDAAEVHAELLEMARPWIGDATVVESQLKKWRYAGPVNPLPERTYVIESNGARIALAGDAFGGPKVEGAFLSGHAAATALLD